ncbi:MAG: sugar phosphate isomerase/epimerase family protein [Micrococcales bacterium]
MKFGYSTITWGGVVGHPGGVTSIKDLFYLTHGDTKAAIRDIADAGYAGTEVFDGNLAEFENSPDELLSVLKETGVQLVSVYTGANFIYDEILDDELYKIKKAATLAKNFGASRLVIGGGAKRPDGPKADDFKKVARGLDMASDIARDLGLESSFHPHLGTISETLDGFHQIMDACSIGFCPDTAHLLASGIDPAAAIDRYGDRLKHVHFKDFDAKSGGFTPLGEGDIDFKAVLAAMRRANYDSWLLVELDSYAGDPKAAAEISKRYLEQLFAN